LVVSDDDVADRLADLEAWREAMSRKFQYQQEQLDELREENERLRERLAELDEVVDPDPGATAYEQLTKPQKVHRLRRTLVEDAAGTQTGKAAMDYRDVRYLFDGHPSPGHAYDLMDAAADLDGFNYDTPSGSGGNKRIRVNLDAVKDETLIHAANKATTGGTV
jgi:regulator of replication initiation timing